MTFSTEKLAPVIDPAGTKTFSESAYMYAPPVPFLTPFCVFHIPVFGFACRTAGSPPSLDTVPGILRIPV